MFTALGKYIESNEFFTFKIKVFTSKINPKDKWQALM